MGNSKFVTYEQFGAVADGKADDMPAIVRAHTYANENGLPVICKDGAEYYIGGKDLTAVIMTPTDFGTAKFIIDDRKLENIKTYCFEVKSSYESFAPEITSISKGQKHISFPHDGNVYVRVFSDKKKIFIRKGLNQNKGTDITDCFVVDECGNVTVDIDRDIQEITRVFAKRIDDEPITVKGGTFLTIANQWVSEYKYHNRGFKVTRSNVTLEGITHLIEGEGDHGAPYSGFFTLIETTNVTIKSCLLTPHKTYYTASALDKSLPVGMGTYELSFGASIHIRLLGIRQTRDINDRTYWGLMGSNFCKDIYIDDCIMSRFDAHTGVSGVTIKNSEFGHQCLSLIGYGDFYIENSTVNGGSFVSFRPDYGSFWDGRITIKNCIWKPRNPNNLVMFSATNTQDHDFGYVCYMPSEIIVEGFYVDDSNSSDDTALYILPVYDKSYSDDKPNRYITVKKLSIKGLKTSKSKTATLTEKKELYKDIEFEICE